MFKGIRRYFKKSIKNVNYELKYEKEIEKHEKTKIKLNEAYDRIRFLEKELDRNYQNGRILYLQKIIRKKNEIIDNLREDNLKLMKRGKWWLILKILKVKKDLKSVIRKNLENKQVYMTKKIIKRNERGI